MDKNRLYERLLNGISHGISKVIDGDDMFDTDETFMNPVDDTVEDASTYVNHAKDAQMLLSVLAKKYPVRNFRKCWNMMGTEDKAVLNEIYYRDDSEWSDELKTLLRRRRLHGFMAYMCYVFPMMDNIIRKIINIDDFDREDKRFIKTHIQQINSRKDPLCAYFKVHDVMSAEYQPEGETAQSFGGWLRYRFAVLDIHDMNLNWIDVSEITNMSQLFYYVHFDGDISLWDVSHVTDMRSIFIGSNFSGNIKDWQISEDCAMSWELDGDYKVSAFNNVPMKNRPKLPIQLKR